MWKLITLFLISVLFLSSCTQDSIEVNPAKAFKAQKHKLFDGVDIDIYSQTKIGMSKGEVQINLTTDGGDWIPKGNILNTRKLDIDCTGQPDQKCNVILESNYELELRGYKLIVKQPVNITGGQVGNTWTPPQIHYLTVDFFDFGLGNTSNITFTQINEKTYSLDIYGYLDPTQTYTVDSAACTDGVCNNVAFNGNAIQLMGNRSVTLLVPFEDGVFDVSHNEYSLSANGAETYVDGEKSGTKAYRITDGANNYIISSDPFNYQFGSTHNMIFLSRMNHSEGGDAEFAFIDTRNDSQRNGLIYRKNDDDSIFKADICDSSGCIAESGSSSFTINNGLWQSIGFRFITNTAGRYKVDGKEENEFLSDNRFSNMANPNQGFTLFEDRISTNKLENGDIDFVQAFNVSMDNQTFINCGTSKHGCFLENDGNYTTNFTYGSSGDTVNVSFVVDDTDSQSSLCFKVAQETSSPWRCSNTTEISLSGTFSEIGLNISFNTTNSSKTPILKSVTVDLFTVAAPPAVAVEQINIITILRKMDVI